ncbi:MAG: ABC transporter ATP-binding protein [Thermomicrobiales bacterium]
MTAGNVNLESQFGAGAGIQRDQRELLLEVRNLKTYFKLDEGTVRAVDGVSYNLYRGRTLGIVGESGCGKSVTAQSILRIVPSPGQIVDGEIIYHRRQRESAGQPVATSANGGGFRGRFGGRGPSRVAADGVEQIDLTTLNPRGQAIRDIRGNEIALIFQEPMSSLSPVHTVGHQMIQTIVLHQKVSKEEARERGIEMLARVGIPRPREAIDRYSHQLSGGQRQRAVIALALSCKPSLLIADEPTTALDVTTEAQILELMKELQRDLGMAIQIITHNLGVVAEMADDIMVMYLGKEVEQAPVEELFHNPKHPYTKALLRSIPRLGRKTGRRLESIEGMVPDPFSIPAGCTFHTRCPFYKPGICDDPQYVQVGPNHWARCARTKDIS